MWCRSLAAGQADFADAPAPVSCRSCRSVGGSCEASFGEVRSVGEAGGITTNHPYTGTSFASTSELFNSTIIEQRRRIHSVLCENFGKIAAGLEGSSERSTQEIGFNQFGGHS